MEEGEGILGLDLQRIRGRVERVGWVEEAKVVRLLPDTLVIAVKERRPVAVWQHRAARPDRRAGAPIAAPTPEPSPPCRWWWAPRQRRRAEILPLLQARPG